VVPSREWEPERETGAEVKVTVKTKRRMKIMPNAEGDISLGFTLNDSRAVAAWLENEKQAGRKHGG